MTAALSHVEREGAARTQSDVDSYAPQPALHLNTLHRQGIDYEESARSELTPAVDLDAKKVRSCFWPRIVENARVLGHRDFYRWLPPRETNEPARNPSCGVSQSRICAGRASRDRYCAGSDTGEYCHRYPRNHPASQVFARDNRGQDRSDCRMGKQRLDSAHCHVTRHGRAQFRFDRCRSFLAPHVYASRELSVLLHLSS